MNPSTTSSLISLEMLLFYFHTIWKLCLEWIFVLAYFVRRSCFSASTFNSISFQLL